MLIQDASSLLGAYGAACNADAAAGRSQAKPTTTVHDLPGDVWDNIGSCLSKRERRQAAHALPFLKSMPCKTWPDDRIFDYLVPYKVQEAMPLALEREGACPQQRADALRQEQRQERLWLRTYHNLLQLQQPMAPGASTREACPAGHREFCSPEATITQLHQACAVRYSAPFAAQTLLALPDDQQLLLIPPESSLVTYDALLGNFPHFKGRLFDLTQPSDSHGIWPSGPLSIEGSWREPVALRAAGRHGLMAATDADDVLRLWHVRDNALSGFDEPPGRNPLTASCVAFTDHACPENLVVFAGSTQGAELVGLHGLNIYAPHINGSEPRLAVVEAKSVADLPKVTHVGVDAASRRAVTVDINGSVRCWPLPFADAAQFTSFCAQPLPPYAFDSATISDNNDVVALRSRKGGVVVVRPGNNTIKELWRWPGDGVPHRQMTAAQQSSCGISKYALNPEGSRIGVLTQEGQLQIWDLQSDLAPISRIRLPQERIVSFVFSPYSHARLLTGASSTQFCFPLDKPLLVPLPHLHGTGVFMPGVAQVVGLTGGKLCHINLTPRKATAADAS